MVIFYKLWKMVKMTDSPKLQKYGKMSKTVIF